MKAYKKFACEFKNESECEEELEEEGLSLEKAETEYFEDSDVPLEKDE